jgi:secreted trypsin-like serine protease
VLRKVENTIIEANGPLLKYRFNSGDLALALEDFSGGGDSGGPAYMLSEKGYEILGINSRAEVTNPVIGKYAVMEVYTRVSFFADWINKVIEADVGSRNIMSLAKLRTLPSGLTQLNLDAVCNGIKTN